MTLQELTELWLRRNGYDGLYSEGGSCACAIEDLMPCSEPSSDCHAGYKVPCDPETCDADGDCKWHIAECKPESEVQGG